MGNTPATSFSRCNFAIFPTCRISLGLAVQETNCRSLELACPAAIDLTFQLLEAIPDGFQLHVHSAKSRRVASLACLNRRCPLVEFSREGGFDTLQLLFDPLLVFFSQTHDVPF